MITSNDRSGWIGASDTHWVMGNWDTPSFAKWWLTKLGARHDSFKTLAMQTGTAFEHRILEYIGVSKMDRQIRNKSLRLRVNLDGETSDRIKEVKTYKANTFKVSKPYWQQAQVEMFAARKGLDIVAYRLEPEDYKNWFREICPERLAVYPIEYDEAWTLGKYLPRLEYLAQCLKGGVFPKGGAI